MSNVRSMPPRPEPDPLAGLPEDARKRVMRFLEASRKVNCEDFRGAVLMSLIIYADDYLLDKAIDDAITTCQQVHGGGRVS